VIQNNKSFRDKNIEVLLTFLKETKDGKYAIIEKTSLPFARIPEETEMIDIGDEEYYYSIG
jgi:hypothetical protein